MMKSSIKSHRSNKNFHKKENLLTQDVVFCLASIGLPAITNGQLEQYETSKHFFSPFFFLLKISAKEVGQSETKDFRKALMF